MKLIYFMFLMFVASFLFFYLCYKSIEFNNLKLEQYKAERAYIVK